MIKIAPSILSADFGRLADAAEMASSADLLHIDVMDGHFVPNITVGPATVAALRATSRVPLDVHLMIDNPDMYVETFATAGSSIITVHAEAPRHLHRTLQAIRSAGARVGVAINPATPACAVEHVLDIVDLVLVMTVNPGFGGQRFIEGMLGKIQEIRTMVDAVGREIDVEVDGGIALDTAPSVVRAGANVLVAGSFVFGDGEPSSNISRLRAAAHAALGSR